MAIRRGDELMAPAEGSVKVAKKSDRLELGMIVLAPYVAVLIVVIIVIIVIVNN